MAHLRVPQGAEGDLDFTLREGVGEPLTDDQDWTDGTTAAQWPTSTFEDTDGNDVTSDWVKDITGETIDDASHIHPDPTTGLWRKSEGRYRQRVQPSSNTSTLPLATYRWTIEYDVGGIRDDETHDVSLVKAGDVGFGDDLFATVTVDEIRNRVETQIGDTQLQELIQEGSDEVAGYLDDYSIDVNSFTLIPTTLVQAVKDWTEIFVFDYDASAFRKVSNVREGSLAYGFSGQSNINRREMLANLISEDEDQPGKLYRFVKKHSPHFQPTMRRTRKRGSRNRHNRGSTRGRRGGNNRGR